MKIELIVAIVLASLSIGERHLRSTVLTDESKRIIEHFDFSNFDKQEALNYLDRQRYDNQIRGKRSHSKYRKDQFEKNGRISDITESQMEDDNDVYHFNPEPEDERPIIHYTFSKFPTFKSSKKLAFSRRKRGRHHKKKHKYKVMRYDNDYDDLLEDEEMEERRRYRKRKRKKKKKRHYWDRWTEWSPCSVTCGRGRKIRWRKCIAKNCTTGELEMGEKTCQLPACNLLTKLLGL